MRICCSSHRWRKAADQAGHPIKRVVVAYWAGRDGFWLARWLQVRGVEAYVIHPTSVAVSREYVLSIFEWLSTRWTARRFARASVDQGCL